MVQRAFQEDVWIQSYLCSFALYSTVYILLEMEYGPYPPLPTLAILAIPLEYSTAPDSVGLLVLFHTSTYNRCKIRQMRDTETISKANLIILQSFFVFCFTL